VAVQERTERVVIERQRGLADRLLSIGKAAAPFGRSRFAPRNMAICSMARTGCQMILDTSAIVAILQDEPESPAFAHAVEDNRPVRVSAANWLEAAILVDGNRSPR